MVSPFDLTSFSGFKSFGIERDDVCDDDGAVFALQMSEKRSREGGPYDAMLARLLDGAKLLLADEVMKSMTQAGIKALAELKQNKEENPTVSWQGGPLLMTVGYGCFQGIHTGTSALLNIRIGTIEDF